MARPDLKARVVLVPATTNTGRLYILGFAEENGGSVSNMEPASKILEAAKPNIIQGRGFPIEFVVPEKGIYATFTYLNVVKGMKYPETRTPVQSNYSPIKRCSHSLRQPGAT